MRRKSTNEELALNSLICFVWRVLIRYRISSGVADVPTGDHRMSVTLTINGINKTVNVEPDTPLLWVIRDHLQLTGTKYGCGIAQCGACTVHLEGKAIRSCVMPVSAVAGKTITTIEGVSADQQSDESKAIQQAWEDIAVVQCGYCQSGQIMSATTLLTQNPNPSDKDIDDFMSGNICRCSTYVRIKKAIKQAAASLVYNAVVEEKP